MDSVFEENWLLKGVSKNVRQQIYTHGEIVSFGPNEILIQAGRPNKFLFVVLSGRVGIELPDSMGGVSLPLATREPGDVLGDYSFFDSEPPTVSVIAEVSSSAFRITHASLQVLLADDAETRSAIYHNMLAYLVSRLRSQDAEQLVDICIY
jgi:CRP-like cAMP-binding protein